MTQCGMLYRRLGTAQGLECQIRALKLYCDQNKIADNDEIDSVMVFAHSRFVRSVPDMLKGLEARKKHGTNFVSLTVQNVTLPGPSDFKC